MKSPIRLIALAIVPSLVVIAIIPLFLTAVPAPQKTETVDGVRVVHNIKGGMWGKNPQIVLELVRKIGDVETEDEHLAFNYPSDVAVDKDGNIYVLDSANTRIQKFGPDGKFLATIGRKGQGPGEFLMPDAIGFRQGRQPCGRRFASSPHPCHRRRRPRRPVRGRQGRDDQRRPPPPLGGFRRPGLDLFLSETQPAGQDGRTRCACSAGSPRTAGSPARSAGSPISASP